MLRANYDHVWLMDQTAAKLPLRSYICTSFVVWLSFGIPHLLRCGHDMNLVRIRLRRTSVDLGSPQAFVHPQEDSN